VTKKLITRNKFEESVYKQLKRKRVSFGYESHSFSYVIASKYIPDFSIASDNGRTIYIETKGYLRPEDKRKLIAVRKCNPDIDLRILFQVYNKKNIRWADRNKILWAIGKVPKEWLK